MFEQPFPVEGLVSVQAHQSVVGGRRRRARFVIKETELASSFHGFGYRLTHKTFHRFAITQFFGDGVVQID
ncbi:MAG TPA: hypothetical protein VEC06_02020 [Paucimonas sp.]|nr:hypothetical protein [Paucimonas sp.]